MNLANKNEIIPDENYSGELLPGATLLHGQYTIESFLNSGGFGMTYLAKDSLDRTVVIKECFPTSFCCRDETAVRARSRAQEKDFRSIVTLFVQEARRLSKLKHPNIVGVHQVFEANETAYMALDYVEGQDLFDIAEDENLQLEPKEIQTILLKILDAVGFIHEQNILHRDIAPDNILLDRWSNPVLIDFGAAREKATQASKALSALLVVKDGYSPQEFYVAGSEQGPASDIYALGATFYHLITGEAPPSSQERLTAVKADRMDPYEPIATRSKDYDRHFLAAIDKALNVYPGDRLQSAQEWVEAVDYEKRKKAALAKAEIDKNTELSISKLVTETNEIVLKDRQGEDAKKTSRSRKIANETAVKSKISTKPQTSELHQVPSKPNTTEKPDAPRRWVFKGSAEKQPTRRFWNLG